MLGYTKEKILKMLKAFPNLFDLSVKNINDKIDEWVELGFDRNSAIKLGYKIPFIFGYKKENLEKRIKNIMCLGYNYDDVISMISVFPELFSTSLDNMKQKINDLINLGYSYEQVMMITKKFPQIYSLSIENIREKKEFYDMLGIGFVILLEPKRLIQSMDLSYARYMFYLSIGIHINKDNWRKLFIDQKQFMKSYNKTNDDLINQYCNLDSNSKKNKKLIN